MFTLTIFFIALKVYVEFVLIYRPHPVYLLKWIVIFMRTFLYVVFYICIFYFTLTFIRIRVWIFFTGINDTGNN